MICQVSGGALNFSWRGWEVWVERRPADWKRCWSLEREPGCLSWWAGRWEGSLGLSSKRPYQNGLASTF